MDDWEPEVDADIPLNAEPVIKRGPGRPKGTKNRPKETLKTSEALRQLYNRFSPYLTKEQRKYVEGVIRGDQDLDCFVEMELLVRQMALMMQGAATEYFARGIIDEKIAKFSDSLRMAIKDLEDMRVRKEETESKKQEADGLVQISGQRTPLERVDRILERVQLQNQ